MTLPSDSVTASGSGLSELHDLHAGWQCARTAPGACTDPAALTGLSGWLSAPVPGTAATALAAASQWSLDQLTDFDAEDWWYRTELPDLAPAPDSTLLLHFDGLATLADVYLNGALVGTSENMFTALVLNVTEQWQATGRNQLAIRFRALNPVLAQRRPRPRWRPRIIEHQALRFIRTTLLGRMPSWCPPVKAVGPWRPVRLEVRRSVQLDGVRIRAAAAGESGGNVALTATLRAPAGAVVAARLIVDGSAADCALQPVAEALQLTCSADLPSVEHWWPHTHGAQARYEAVLSLTLANGEIILHPLGHVAFRCIDVDREADGAGFGLRVNGVPIFCRGACWTPVELASLGASDEALEAALVQVRDAGMNMLRIGGTMVYESDAFYDRCDALGILVWQDFMFANMDYPMDDPHFVESVRTECAEFLVRTQTRACLAVLCGGSEVEQQAAMLGVDRGAWQSPLTTELLPTLAAALRPDAVYLTNSPTGGALPFHVNEGVGHYYGVGAYLRPLDDARRANVRFTSECLAFANVPETPLIEALLSPNESPVHHPRWKRGVPRDAGSGWDFEDVRDHYLQRLFGVDPMRLRYADMERYLALSRITTGEVMAATIGEWRRSASSCRGALVWFLRDLWPGAGWGVVDVSGEPKAAWHFLRRACQSTACTFTDEGVNGLHLHLQHEGPRPVTGRLVVTAFRNGEVETARAKRDLVLDARSSLTLPVDALFDGFHDFSYAYRFGPPTHDVIAAELRSEDAGAVLLSAVHLPLGLARPVEDELGLAATLQSAGSGWIAQVSTRRFAHAVSLDAPNWTMSDNYFPLAPGATRTIRLTPRTTDGKPPRLRVSALNCARSVAAIVRESRA